MHLAFKSFRSSVAISSVESKQHAILQTSPFLDLHCHSRIERDWHHHLPDSQWYQPSWQIQNGLGVAAEGRMTSALSTRTSHAEWILSLQVIVQNTITCSTREPTGEGSELRRLTEPGNVISCRPQAQWGSLLEVLKQPLTSSPLF